MSKTLAAIACASALTLPAGNVWAATQAKTVQKKKVVTVSRSVTGPLVDVDRWGQLQVAIKVNVTTTTVGGKATKSFKVTSVSFPVYPSHTDRSVFISRQALPLLRQEVLQLKGARSSSSRGRPTRATPSSRPSGAPSRRPASRPAAPAALGRRHRGCGTAVASHRPFVTLLLDRWRGGC